MKSEPELRPVVCSFESRRAEEMCSLIQRQQAIPLSAPSMQEVPLDNNPVAIRFIQDCLRDQYPFVILMTGVGTEALLELAKSQQQLDDLLAALHRTTLIVRGPKPAAVLAKVGLRYAVKAPEPNTWRELLAALDAACAEDPGRFSLSGRAVAVQEYGLPNLRFYEALSARGAVLTPVPVYRWALPDDIQPLQQAVREIAAGKVDVVLFTSAWQLNNVLTVAEQLQLADQFRQQCAGLLVGSIGPTCSEALTDHGLPVHFEASPPKMGQLVRGAIEAWHAQRAPGPPSGA